MRTKWSKDGKPITKREAYRLLIKFGRKPKGIDILVKEYPKGSFPLPNGCVIEYALIVPRKA